MRLRASCFASIALLAGLAVPVTASAQGGASVTFGGSTDAPPPPPPPAPGAPPPAAPPATGAVPATPGDAAAAAPTAADEAADETAEAAEWAERDRWVNESNTLNGGSGLLKTQHAETGSVGQFRLQFVTEWFKAGFLCTSQYPCGPLKNSGGHVVTSDTMNHIGSDLSLSGSLAKLGAGTLEGYAGLTAYANSDSANAAAGQPELLQVLGDMDFGLKYVAPVGDILHLGLFSELWLINGTGSVGLDGGGTSAKFGGIATVDLRKLEAHVPLRFSVNAVYFLDNSASVLSSTEQAIGTPVTRIDRYGLGINRVDQFQIFVGAELLAADERVRPFIEEKLGIPNNRQGYRCPANGGGATITDANRAGPSNDQCLANDKVIPSTLTIGSRFFPWKRGFSLLAALDIGEGGTNNFIQEVQPTPPWTLYIGAGWAVDTNERPPVIKTKVVEKPVEKVAPHGHVVGFVHEKDKNDPVQGAIVSYKDRADLSPLATAADGKFSDDVPAGAYTFDIKADGFKPGACDATVPKEGGSVSVDCPLEALPRLGIVNGHVRDADSNNPIAGVQVVVRDSQNKELRLTSDSSGAFKFDAVTPGTAQVSVTADPYLVMVMPAEVKPRAETTVDLLLRQKPKQGLVTIGKNEISIKQQIQFALDSAVILPESFGLLTEIADTLIRHPELRKVEVQGHTDNSGTAEHNKVLSEQRAEAVRAWLVQHGVPSDKLVARGYGQERPIAPNVTASNRARNRRVQFIILEKDGAAPAPPAAPAAPGQRKKNPLPGF